MSFASVTPPLRLTSLLPFAVMSRPDRNSFATASSGCLVAVLVVLVPH